MFEHMQDSKKLWWTNDEKMDKRAVGEYIYRPYCYWFDWEISIDWYVSSTADEWFESAPWEEKNGAG